MAEFLLSLSAIGSRNYDFGDKGHPGEVRKDEGSSHTYPKKGVEPISRCRFQKNQQRQCKGVVLCSHPDLISFLWIWKDRPRDFIVFLGNLAYLILLALVLWLLGGD